MSKLHVGIFGPGQSGKTTLAKAILTEMAKKGFGSLVLDKNQEEGWPKESETFVSENQFWQVVWQEQRKVICVEEATETIARKKNLIPVFTRLRHLGHKLCVVGHSGTNLLPIMREQLHTLFLFRQPPKSAEIWAETFADERIMTCTDLAQYEFLRCILFGGKDRKNLIQKNILTLPKK